MSTFVIRLLSHPKGDQLRFYVSLLCMKCISEYRLPWLPEYSSLLTDFNGFLQIQRIFFTYLLEFGCHGNQMSFLTYFDGFFPDVLNYCIYIDVFDRNIFLKDPLPWKPKSRLTDFADFSRLKNICLCQDVSDISLCF